MVCRTLRKCVTGATTDEVFHTTHAQVSVCKVGPVWGDKTWCVSVTSVTSCPVSTVCSSQNADAEIFNTAVSLTLVFTLRFPRMLLHLMQHCCWWKRLVHSAGRFRTTLHFCLVPGCCCFHPCSVQRLKKTNKHLFQSHCYNLSSSSSFPSSCFSHFANRKSLPHLPHAPPFPFSADASGSKIRQQLWLMCGYKHGRLGSLSLVPFCVPSVPVCLYLSHPAQTSGVFGGTAS